MPYFSKKASKAEWNRAVHGPATPGVWQRMTCLRASGGESDRGFRSSRCESFGRASFRSEDGRVGVSNIFLQSPYAT
jgi:hypothetical protein